MNWRSSIQSAKTRPGADYGSDHQLLIANFRFNLKKVGKIHRPLRHNLNQIPYDYTVEVMNRFQGFDLVDRELEELWTELRNTVQKAVTKTTSKKKKCKKAKWLSEEALQTAEKRKVKSKGETERYNQLNTKFQRITREDKTFFNEQCKEVEANNKMGKV